MIDKESYEQGYKDGQEALAKNFELCIEEIKAEIKQKAWDTQEIDGEHENYKVVELSDVLQILDNIGKAENELIVTDEEVVNE